MDHSDPTDMAPEPSDVSTSGDISEAERTALWEAATGPRASRYHVPRFTRFAGGYQVLSWNWLACFLTAGWLIQHRMFGAAAAYLLTLVLALWGGFRLLYLGGYYADIVIGGYAIVGWLVLPVFANVLYYRSTSGRIARAVAKSPSMAERERLLQPAGGVPRALRYLAAGVLSIYAMLTWVGLAAMPGFWDTEVRVRVSAVIKDTQAVMKRVDQMRLEEGRLPKSLDELQDGPTQTPRNAKAIRWNPASRTLEVELGGSVLEGGVLTFRLASDDAWICTVRNIDRRYVPPWAQQWCGYAEP